MDRLDGILLDKETNEIVFPQDIGMVFGEVQSGDGRYVLYRVAQAEIDELKSDIEFMSTVIERETKTFGKQQSEIDELKAEREWVGVKERLPEAFDLVIVCQGDAVFTGKMLASDDWESGNGLLIQTPDYWMPMPKAKHRGKQKNAPG